MNILVFVKQVPDDVVKVHVGEDGKPAVGGIDKIVNAFDTYAVEMAVRLCEAVGGRVIVASLGHEAAVRPSLVQMIAVGAARAYIGSPVDGADEGVVAAQLAAMARQCEEQEAEPFDLILCGKESTDEISSQVGAMLAEKLGLGFVSSVVEITVDGDGLKAKRETEEGFDYYETTMPAVFTVAKPDYDPRYPTLKSKMAARKAVIPCLEAVVQGLAPVVSCLKYEEPPKREAGVKIQEKEAEEAVLKALELMKEDKVL